MMGTSYQLIDSGNFQKLEQIGPYRLIRPSPQAVWDKKLPANEWRADAEYLRKSDGSGHWINRGKVLKNCNIELAGVVFSIQFTSFGHLGIFPEQANNWEEMSNLISQVSKENSPPRILNLFAYTGGSTLAAAKAGAEVTHVDASTSSVSWARENARVNGLSSSIIRWICEDVRKFVQKEIRRGKSYDGIILDPPSFGRGNKGEVWKIEKDLNDLLAGIEKLLAPRGFVLLSAHSAGYSPLTLRNLLTDSAQTEKTFCAQEMVIIDKQGQGLPSGACCLRQSL